MVVQLVLLAAFGGGLLQAATGFGYSLICMSAYAMVLPIKLALVLQATTAFFTIAWYAYRLRRYANWRILLIPAVVALAASFLGLEIAESIDADTLKRCLGIALVLLSVLSLVNKGAITFSRGIAGQIIAGSVSGFLGGLTNMSGPPMVLYLLQVTDDKDEYNGTLQCFFFVLATFKMIVHLTNGRITSDLLAMLPPILLATTAGSLIGFYIFRKMNMKMVKKAVNIIMIFVGLYYTLL